MSIQESEWQEEQQRVDMVTDKMAAQIEQLAQEVGKVRGEVIDVRKHFWDEVSINLSNSDDIVETHFSIKQQAEVLSERERRYRHGAEALRHLTRMIDSPYFGRIDFKEAGTDTEQIYVGIHSFRDGDDFLVYDWRAPIASLYYDYAPGPAEYQAPMGQVSGEMTLKRQYGIRNRQINHLFDTSLTIGDELLMEVLSHHKDTKMKNIVATIQKEQNQIIRNDTSRMLIVQGAAGSGKTSAALQRVAYLLYKHRDTLRSDQMVLFSPNPLFNSYVSSVLPELGEENMQQTTFAEYLEHRLGKTFQLEDVFSQMEYILSARGTPGYEVRISGIRYKSSSDFLDVLHTYANSLEQAGMLFLRVSFDGREIITAEDITTTFYSFDPAVRLTHRVELLQDWLQKRLIEFENAELSASWVEEEINLLEPEDYHRADQKLYRMQQNKNVTFDDFDKQREILARMVVRRKMKPLRKWIKQLAFVNVAGIYRQLFASTTLFAEIAGEVGAPAHWPGICQQTIVKLDKLALFYEDSTPFLYLKELLLGLHTNTSVRHLIVDEGQDYSPIQFEFLKRLFPRSRMTVLGDLNQAIYVHQAALSQLDFLSQLYGHEFTEIIQLMRSYRSTQEIVEFTRGMLPGGTEIIPFHRSGDVPVVIEINNDEQRHNKLVADIETLQANGYKSIAVICKTAHESADAYATLHERVAMHLITKYTPTFEQGTLVIPAYLAKGVEFDAVLIYDGSAKQYGHDDERKLFYTACTRAMHQLHIYTLGAPSPFIQQTKTKGADEEVLPLQDHLKQI